VHAESHVGRELVHVAPFLPSSLPFALREYPRCNPLPQVVGNFGPGIVSVQRANLLQMLQAGPYRPVGLISGVHVVAIQILDLSDFLLADTRRQTLF
jgi:hypothetical protein